jgi:hypothetical protein
MGNPGPRKEIAPLVTWLPRDEIGTPGHPVPRQAMWLMMKLKVCAVSVTAPGFLLRASLF